MTGFWKISKNPNFWHLIPFNPWIKIFYQISSCVTLFTLLTQTSCNISEKSNERFPRYLKTNGRTNKGDNYGPHWVNLGSKIERNKQKEGISVTS